jgi:hypothetical protein
LVNEIANRAFLTGESNISLSNTPPKQYLPEIEGKYPGALGKQFVPSEPALWELDQYEAFLAIRRDLLAESINALLGNLLDPAPPTIEADVTGLIALGESAALEFKSSMRWDTETRQVNKALEKVIAKTIAGFLNAEGGTLLIGVADDGTTLGIEDDLKTLGKRQDLDGFQQHLVQIVAKYLGVEFSPFWRYRFQPVDGRTVAIVDIDRSPQEVFLHDGGKSEFFARVGGTTQPLDVEAAASYIQMHWQT